MKFKGVGRKRPASMRHGAVPATAFSVVLAVIGAGIFLHPGTDTADVDLHDGGIWVMNQSANLVGHVNYQSRTLDGGFLANSTSYDVLQHEGDVMLETPVANGTDVDRIEWRHIATTYP